MAYLKYYLYKKQISRDDGQTWSDVDPTELSPSGNPIGTYDTLGECESATPPEPPTPENDYFTIIAKSSGYVSMGGTSNSATLSYSVNGGTWSLYSNSFYIPVSVGDRIRVRSTSKPQYKGHWSFRVWYLNGYDDDNIEYELYGNIMSLGYGDNFTGVTSMTEMFDAYSQLCDNKNIVSAENLVLPATILSKNCYDGMFLGCKSLTTAPELPAMTLADSCYRSMFYGCSSLTAAPDLPATTLANNCYANMFLGCTALTTAPEMSATTVASGSCSTMFYGCTNLTTAPELPATTVPNSAYTSMFEGCTSLTTAPALPATTLGNYCYYQMFSGCTSLASAPSVLPSTTLTIYCYCSMFEGCTSLTAAPELPATTLKNYCYCYMFSGCTSLSNITCLATNKSATGCTKKWVADVASSGTFTKAAGVTWSDSNSGIPSGWIVQDA